MRDEATEGAAPKSPNRLSPLGFVLVFGAVSGLADFVYEGARSVTGPYLATLGASAALVGVVTGVGEAVALVFRLVTGRWSDRSGRHWALSIAGYVITIVSVPLLGVGGPLGFACLLVIAERFGKSRCGDPPPGPGLPLSRDRSAPVHQSANCDANRWHPKIPNESSTIR